MEKDLCGYTRKKSWIYYHQFSSVYWQICKDCTHRILHNATKTVKNVNLFQNIVTTLLKKGCTFNLLELPNELNNQDEKISFDMHVCIINGFNCSKSILRS